MVRHDESAESATAEKAAERLTFFSDAVVAIAITLLAIELPVPSGSTVAELVASFAETRGEYVTFLISFVVIANHWLNHHRIFRYVARADGPIVALNLLWLLVIVLTPFLTKLLNEGDVDIVRFAAYAVAQIVQLVVFGAMIVVLRRRSWWNEHAPAALRERRILQVSFVIAIGFAVSVPAFLLVGPLAYVLWVALPVLLGLLENRSGRPGR